jgi:probable rRNA maturation factor
VNVFLADEQSIQVDLSEIVPLAEHVMRMERLPEDSEVAIVLIDNAEMARYNELYMGKPGPTDVLSFPIEDGQPGEPLVRDPDGPPVNLGDIFIAPQVVSANASAAGVALQDELALMVVHGMLHLLGWDHEDDGDAALMEARERDLLAVLERTRL